MCEPDAKTWGWAARVVCELAGDAEVLLEPTWTNSEFAASGSSSGSSACANSVIASTDGSSAPAVPMGVTCGPSAHSIARVSRRVSLPGSRARQVQRVRMAHASEVHGNYRSGDASGARRASVLEHEAAVSQVAAEGVACAVGSDRLRDDEQALAALEHAVGWLQGLPLDGRDLVDLEAHLDAIRAPMARLGAYRALVLTEIATRRAAAAGKDDQRGAVEREGREVGRQQRLEPHEAKQAAGAGQAARRFQQTGDAFRAGRLSDRQTALIGQALARIAAERRPAVEAELIALAATRHGPAFAREVRRIEAREAPIDAQRRARFRHSRRSFRMWDNDDGGVDLTASLSGLAAETLRETMRAFTRPDASGEQRSSEQRAADGLEAACQAALRSGAASTSHGVRPQVMIVATVDELRHADGTVRFAGSGEATTWTDLGAVLGDCRLSLLLRDAKGTPLRATEAKRTVPAGLWRALVARDGGCVWEGCDAPASWCDVAHGDDAFRSGGQLEPGNAALLCRRHHRLFDGGWYDIRIDGGSVHFERRAVRRSGSAAWSAMTSSGKANSGTIHANSGPGTSRPSRSERSTPVRAERDPQRLSEAAPPDVVEAGCLAEQPGHAARAEGVATSAAQALPAGDARTSQHRSSSHQPVRRSECEVRAGPDCAVESRLGSAGLLPPGTDVTHPISHAVRDDVRHDVEDGVSAALGMDDRAGSHRRLFPQRGLFDP